MLAGCYDPHPSTGTPCPEGICPHPLKCSAATATCEDSAIDAMPDTAELPTFAELSGQQWLMPCTAAPNPTLCDCIDVMTEVTVGGVPGVTYTVKVRIRGAMERGTYGGGTAQGAWYVGGQTTSTILTVAELLVSTPQQHYFLNNVMASPNGLSILDYEATLSIGGGAKIGLLMTALDAREITSTNAVVPGVTTNPSPYLGQFAQIDVVQVTGP